LDVGNNNHGPAISGPNWNICIAMSQARERQDCEVAIIGTGPYGLSLAAQLMRRRNAISPTTC
jgi:NADPH-dependent 2,4-dienoyl-CoA reductase/sulfur reductase-like enzyme